MKMMIDDERAENLAHEVAPWVGRLARFGYAAKGMVYVVVGWLALQAAIGTGGETTDTRGALESIFRQPFGPWLLLVVSLGLFSYAGWRLVQGILDVEDKGTSVRGIAKRIGYTVSGFAYGGLGLSAFRQSIGLASTEGRSQEDWTALVLSHPLGRWLVFGASAVLIVLAVNAGVVAVRGLFHRKLKDEEMSETVEHGISALAVAGLLARGTVFGLLGAFFFSAGWQADASDAGGLSDALVAIARQPYGPLLLGLTAVGLLCYGLFALVQARYRRIEVD